MLDRKAVTRAYKDGQRPMGVYRVYNTANGKSFVGSAVDVLAKLNSQRAQLEFGSHMNRELQAEWKSFGPDAFRFEVLEELEAPRHPRIRTDEGSSGARGDVAGEARALWRKGVPRKAEAGSLTAAEPPSTNEARPSLPTRRPDEGYICCPAAALTFLELSRTHTTGIKRINPAAIPCPLAQSFGCCTRSPTVRKAK